MHMHVYRHMHIILKINGSLVLTKNPSQSNTHRFSPSWAFIRCVSSTHTWSINTGMATCTCYTFRNMWIRCTTWMTNLSETSSCGTVASFPVSEGLGYEASGTGICMCLMGNGRLACNGRSLHFRGSRMQAGGMEVVLRENWGGCVCVCVHMYIRVCVIYTCNYNAVYKLTVEVVKMGVNLITGYNNTSSLIL